MLTRTKADRFFLAVLTAASLQALRVRAEEPTAAPAAAVPTEAEEEAQYSYKGEKFRDPFVPLAGVGAGNMAFDFSGEEQAFDPATLELKGVVSARAGRWAVLRSPSGVGYTVRDGKVFDAKRKAISGYVGIIKKKSVVLIGPNNQVTELQLAREGELEGGT